MRRWLLFSLALVAALVALAALRSLGPAGDPPLDEIDQASRERLEQVLRESAGPEEDAR